MGGSREAGTEVGQVEAEMLAINASHPSLTVELA